MSAATPQVLPVEPPAATPQAPPPSEPQAARQSAPGADGGGYPPCPNDSAPPPGHNKGADEQDRPCSSERSDHDKEKDKDKDHYKDKDKDKVGEAVGGVLLVPIAVLGSALTGTRPGEAGRPTGRRLRGRRRAR